MRTPSPSPKNLLLLLALLIAIAFVTGSLGADAKAVPGAENVRVSEAALIDLTPEIQDLRKQREAIDAKLNPLLAEKEKHLQVLSTWNHTFDWSKMKAVPFL